MFIIYVFKIYFYFLSRLFAKSNVKLYVLYKNLRFFNKRLRYKDFLIIDIY